MSRHTGKNVLSPIYGEPPKHWLQNRHIYIPHHQQNNLLIDRNQMHHVSTYASCSMHENGKNLIILFSGMAPCNMVQGSLKAPKSTGKRSQYSRIWNCVVPLHNGVVTCKLCGRNNTYKNTQANIWSHIRYRHPRTYEQLIRRKTNFQQGYSSDCDESSTSIRKYEDVNKMIVELYNTVNQH
jgi:hypothetical protein